MHIHMAMTAIPYFPAIDIDGSIHGEWGKCQILAPSQMRKASIILFTIFHIREYSSPVFQFGIVRKLDSENLSAENLQKSPCTLLTFNLIFGRWRLSVERNVAYSGTTYRIAFARDHSCESPAEAFYDGLPPDEKAQLYKLFQILGDEIRGSPRNPKKIGVLDHELYEFKSFQIRMPFAYAKGDRGLVLITHGFRKKKDKTPPSEITKAKKILQEDAEVSKICIITDHQKRKRP